MVVVVPTSYKEPLLPRFVLERRVPRAEELLIWFVEVQSTARVFHQLSCHEHASLVHLK